MNSDIKRGYELDLPANENFIKAIGVGGGGGNAVKNMFTLGISGVDFIICNTDRQAFKDSPIPTKIILGANLTEGRGAGGNPEVGKNAAIESKDEIKEILSDGTKMVFIAAGMGGGTGTGAAPEIAEIAKGLGILTVAIVTMPFGFEGPGKKKRAEEGVENLKKHCDTVLIILNNKIQELFSDLTIFTAFQKADQVQTIAAKSIAEIITVPGYVNVDFEDVKTVMKDAGTAVMGSGESHGENRALNAVKDAISSPLLKHEKILGSKKVLLSIVFGDSKDFELGMDELRIITDYVREKIGEDAEMIFGYGSQSDLNDRLRVTIIVTGFSDQLPEDNIAFIPDTKKQTSDEKKESMFDEKDKSSKDQMESSSILNEINKSSEKQNKILQNMSDYNFSDNYLKFNCSSISSEFINIPAYERSNKKLNFDISPDSKKILFVS